MARFDIGSEDGRNALLAYVEAESDGADPIDSRHVREGVCVRLESSTGTPDIFKNKGFSFKVLEGLVKDTGEVDLEEAS